MNVTRFEQKSCERIRRYIDQYLSNELPPGACQEIRQHLEKCESCGGEFEALERVKRRLKEVVQSEPVPSDLQDKVRQQLRSSSSPQVNRWLYAAAAALILTLGGWTAARYWNARNAAGGASGNEIVVVQSLPEEALQILKVGSGDHLHCVFDAGFKDRSYTLAEMTEKMGPDHIGLVTVAQQHTPRDFKVMVAHRCRFDGRQFIHLILKNSEKLLSVILTRKNEAESPLARQAANPSAIALYPARLQNFEVTGFESGGYLAFVVSDLSRDENLLVAENLAPAIHGFLTGRQNG
ncbi:MAG TPA: zf-HC2 domain-containing protein [Blastocatellia bacterium]|nr:zf-HC2 domain-containing protein [Blastocatellia bacterium]